MEQVADTIERILIDIEDKKIKKGLQFSEEGMEEINELHACLIDNLRLAMSVFLNGSVRDAVIDTWESEHDIHRGLLERVMIATPHIAGYSTDGKSNGTSMSVQALAKFFGIKQLESWYPKDVPKPADTMIRIDCNGKTKEQILLDAVNFSYDIRDDDRRLRSSPGTFEKLREEYPLRREFGVFEIDPKDIPPEHLAVLKDLGFIIL